MARAKIKNSKKIQRTMVDKNTTVFKHGRYRWVDITKITKSTTDGLATKYKISPEDLLDTLPPLTRSKILVRKDYIFTILLFPYQDKKTNTIKASEINLFIFKNTLITLHEKQLQPLITFPNDLIKGELSHLFMSEFSPAHLVNHLLTTLYEYSLPISNHLANQIDDIESKIYKTELGDQNFVKKIFTLDRKVVDFRKIMRAHPLIIEKLIKYLPQISYSKLPNDLLQDLSELPLSLWTNLESHMEAIDAVQSSYESLTSFRLNDIIKTLTIISIIIAPMTLLAGIFGMNFKSLPFATQPAGFLYAILLMLFFSFLALMFFKYKKWF